MSSFLPSVIFLGACPQCQKGKFYKGLLSLNKCCSQCDCDYSKLETDDGAVAFVTLFIGAIAAIVVFVIEINVSPSYWIYFAYGLPVLLFVTIYAIRVFKSFLALMQYRYMS